MRVFLAKDGHEHIGTGDFFFAATRRLHVHDGALNNTLKTQCGLRIHIVSARHLRRVVLDEVGERLAQIINIGRASAQHFSCAGVVQQRLQ